MNRKEPDPRGAAMQLAIVHRRMIEGYAYAIVRDFHLADDVYQEVATVLITHWQQVPANEGVVPWLKEVTRRKALELQRKQARLPRTLSQEALERVEAAFPVMPEHGLAEALARCVDKLSDDARTAIVGRYGENLDVPKIAARLGRSVQGAYAILKRARLILEECVARSLRQSGETE